MFYNTDLQKNIFENNQRLNSQVLIIQTELQYIPWSDIGI